MQAVQKAVKGGEDSYLLLGVMTRSVKHCKNNRREVIA